MMNLMLKMMNSTLKMMYLMLKMMNLMLKMMNLPDHVPTLAQALRDAPPAGGSGAVL